MSHVREYLLSMITASIICVIVRALTEKKGVSSTIIQFVSAIFLVITILSPWKQGSMIDFSKNIEKYSDDVQLIVNEGVSAAQTETAAIIKREMEAYIVDKAKSLGVILEAEVTLCEDTSERAESVIITTNTSPYLKQRISQYISEDLGIPEDCQLWN